MQDASPGASSRKRKRESLERLILTVLRVRVQARRPVPGLRRLLVTVDGLYAASRRKEA